MVPSNRLFLNFEQIVQPKHANLITNSTIVGVVVPSPTDYITHRPHSRCFVEQYFCQVAGVHHGPDEILPDAQLWKFRGAHICNSNFMTLMTAKF